MPQREQKQVLADFRAGAFNTLVATCIGEEGLDIPQARTTPSQRSVPLPVRSLHPALGFTRGSDAWMHGPVSGGSGVML
jgi:hypothetical protein